MQPVINENEKMIRILVVDDDDLFRQMLKESLDQRGHNVIATSNGLEALKELKKQKFDLVITDIIMPEKEGIETIRETNEKYPAVKIIAISGGSPFLRADLNLTLAKNIGADLTLQKPFLQKELCDAIKSLFPVIK